MTKRCSQNGPCLPGVRTHRRQQNPADIPVCAKWQWRHCISDSAVAARPTVHGHTQRFCRAATFRALGAATHVACTHGHQRRDAGRAPTWRSRDRGIIRRIPTPYLIILGGVSSGFRRYGLHAWRFLFQFGRALLRINREHSPGSRSMFWQPYRCTTPGC